MIKTAATVLLFVATSVAGVSIGLEPKAARLPFDTLIQENFCKDANATAIKQCIDTIKTTENFEVKSNLMKECFGSSNVMDLKTKFCKDGSPRPHLSKASECIMKEFKNADKQVIERFETCLQSHFAEKLIEKKHELEALWSFFSGISGLIHP